MIENELFSYVFVIGINHVGFIKQIYYILLTGIRVRSYIVLIKVRYLNI